MNTSVNEGAYKLIEGHDYEFPVMGYDRRHLTATGEVSPKNIYGTAFSIGDDCYMTAGHAIKAAASENEVVGIGFILGNRYLLAEALEHEEMPEIDIGFIRTVARVQRAKAYKWKLSRIPSLAPVITSGFPFGLTDQGIQTRAFSGYIVSRRRFEALAAKPWVYELSFASPVGLSGAPLVAITHELRVAGLIIGNYETKMMVFSDKETISSDKETIVERYHALQFGIAIQSTDLLGAKSQILKGDLSAHLERNGLL